MNGDGLLPMGWSSLEIAEQQLRDALRAWDYRDRHRPDLDRALVLAAKAHKLLIELDSDRHARRADAP